MPFASDNPDPSDMFDELMAEHDATGDWEADTEMIVPRWSFPRFPGADQFGTCTNRKKSEAKAHTGNHTYTPQCGDYDEDFTPDPGNIYISRAGVGPYDSDVETVAGWLAAPRNLIGGVLLLSEPGTGKTALIEAAVTHADRRILTVLCTADHNRDALFLKFVGEGNGDCIVHDHDHDESGTDWRDDCNRTAFTLGPIPYAAKWGYTLYMDECMLLPDGVKPLLYSLADGRAYLPEGNVDGSALRIHPDFRLVVSSNPSVRGASLPEPLGSRFASTTLTIETTAAMLTDLNIDESIVTAWSALGTQGLWRPAIREMRVANYWLGIDAGQAASAFLGEHCPESQRKAVHDTVVSYIGSSTSLRARDGRLVVS